MVPAVEAKSDRNGKDKESKEGMKGQRKEKQVQVPL